MMVVVVPPFSQGQKGEPPIIPAKIVRRIPSGSEDMRQRVDREGGVKQKSGREKEADQQTACPEGSVNEQSQNHRRNDVVAVQPTKFRIAMKISNQMFGRFLVAFA